MSAFVKLGRKTARDLADVLALRDKRAEITGIESRALAEIRAALDPSTKRTRARAAERAQKTEKRQTKAGRRRDVRDVVAARAGGRCECGCGRWFTELNPMELDHVFGKARAESPETCWALSRDCHRAKTLNQPSARWWLHRFFRFANAMGYRDAAMRAAARIDAIDGVAAAAEVMGVRT